MNVREFQSTYRYTANIQQFQKQSAKACQVMTFDMLKNIYSESLLKTL